jgi:hypothetical protein
LSDSNGIQWFPVLTLILGFASSALLDLWKDHRSSKLKSSEKVEEREYLARQRQNEFQFGNLIAAQDSIGKFLRANGEAHFKDEMEYRKSKKWGHLQIGEELSQRLFDENALLNKLSSRLQNEECRNLIGELRTVHDILSLAKSKDVASKYILAMAQIASRLNDIIGQEIRNTPYN